MDEEAEYLETIWIVVAVFFSRGRLYGNDSVFQ